MVRGANRFNLCKPFAKERIIFQTTCKLYQSVAVLSTVLTAAVGKAVFFFGDLFVFCFYIVRFGLSIFSNFVLFSYVFWEVVGRLGVDNGHVFLLRIRLVFC